MKYNTFLGIYKYKEKIVCACLDFTNEINILYEFENLDLNSLRKLIDKNEILIIKTLKVKPLIKKDNLYKEKYESHQFIDVDITNCSLEPNNELFLYFIEILKKDILVKDILHDIKLYIDVLMFQTESITKLSNNRDNPQLALIGEKYKRVFDKQISFKNTKVSKTRRKVKK